jgi:hypothetical protein
MSVAVFTSDIEAKINEAIAWAEANVLSLEELKLRHSDPSMPPIGIQNYVDIPPSIVAAFTIEIHPGGKMRHLSVSNGKKNSLPVQLACSIATRFGFWSDNALMVLPKELVGMYNEQFEPGRYAVNLLQLYTKPEKK